MTAEVFVDTSAWVAFFRPADGRYRDAANVWQRFVEERTPLVTTDYVLDETVTFLVSHGGHAVSVTAGEAIFESPNTRMIFLGEQVIRAAWDRYRRFTDKEFSFTDVTSFLMMEQLGIRRAFTFDRHFSQAGFEVLSA